ncbi:hypothetical protein P7M20_31160, partial [Vibrio parahaemolyticus]|nr:hypothetical protein [Vibrio parahaemolyticus]
SSQLLKYLFLESLSSASNSISTPELPNLATDSAPDLHPDLSTLVFCFHNSDYHHFFFFFLFFFSELGTEPRALRLLGKCSTAELNPQPLSQMF